MAARLPKREQGPPESGIPSWAYVGAKVVCREHIWAGRRTSLQLPKVGTVYTITRVADHSLNDWPAPAIQVAEIESGSYGFELRAFAPIVTRTQEQDVARFRKHLRPKRVSIDATVRIPHHGTIGE